MMKSISLVDSPALSEALERAGDVLRDGGLVCLPCGGTYRLIADLDSSRAVQRLFAAKRRTKSKPSLSFVTDVSMLETLALDLDPISRRLAERLWPGPLTLLVRPELDLPGKLAKKVCRHRGKIGVRVPMSDVALGVVRALGRPLLVSSANLEKKKGAYSVAQVRKNFLNAVDLLFDAGDLRPAVHSTVVDVESEQVKILRLGAIETTAVEAAAVPAQ